MSNVPAERGPGLACPSCGAPRPPGRLECHECGYVVGPGGSVARRAAAPDRQRARSNQATVSQAESNLWGGMIYGALAGVAVGFLVLVVAGWIDLGRVITDLFITLFGHSGEVYCRSHENACLPLSVWGAAWAAALVGSGVVWVVDAVTGRRTDEAASFKPLFSTGLLVTGGLLVVTVGIVPWLAVPFSLLGIGSTAVLLAVLTARGKVTWSGSRPKSLRNGVVRRRLQRTAGPAATTHASEPGEERKT